MGPATTNYLQKDVCQTSLVNNPTLLLLYQTAPGAKREQLITVKVLVHVLHPKYISLMR